MLVSVQVRNSGKYSYLFGIWIFSVLIASPVAARAKPKTHPLSEAITVDPGATCLDGLAVVQHVRKWLDRDEVDQQVHVLVEGDRKVPDKVHFTIDLEDGYPNRSTFESATDTCTEFHSALGLSIAMAINATLVEPPLSDMGLGPAERQRTQFSVQTLGTFGIINGFAAGLSGRFESFYEWIALRAGMLFVYADNQDIDQDLQNSFDVILIAGRVDLCGGGEPTSAIRLSACAGVTAGPFSTKGKDGGKVIESESNTKPWAAVIMGTEVSFELTDSIGIVLSVDLLRTWWERTIRVQQEDSVEDSIKDPSLDISNWGVSIGLGPIFILH